MPELPEVETLRRDLEKVIDGKVIKKVEVDWAKTVSPLSLLAFKKALTGDKFISVGRKAKMLYFKLKSGKYLLTHLKMTGQLIYQEAGKKAQPIVGGHPQKGGADNLPNKFTRVAMEFVDGSRLFFNDMRKFGYMKLVDEKTAQDAFVKYGPEPLVSDFTLKYFTSILAKYPKRKLKQILLDQQLISGLGNIYVDESCFGAGVLPMRLAKSLSEMEVKKLYQEIKKVIKFSIEKRGTSFSTYVHLNGGAGGFVPHLRVYGRKGERCKRCSGIINRIKLNGRGTHFCSDCQK
ncbi:MAG: DNA-formamidopyrimidine glycosylase [bacterium]